MIQAIWIITRWAETELVPPAKGVIVSAAAFPVGFLTVNIELIVVVSTRNIPEISLVPVALPTTVYASGAPFKVNSNCPASETGTLKNIW